ncbi:MAG: TonB-dependent receptor plug domain-containing protein, partial [Microvirgula sp.]
MGLLLAFSPLAAMADARQGSATDVPELPAVVISDEGASPASTAGAGSLMKMPLKPREIPQSASVVSRERIEQQNLYSLDEVMQQATGVTVQPFQLLTTAYYVR